MRKTDFLITVFIPTYNRLGLLKIAVNSVLQQGNFVKVHILDNASSDGTQQWLEELKQDNGDQVEITLREENIGAWENFSDGFLKVKTPYCVPLADDDELCPSFLEEARSIIVNNPNIGGVVYLTDIRQDGASIEINPTSNPDCILSPLDHIKKWCKDGHYFSWSSIVWKTEILEKVNFNIEFKKFKYFGDAWVQYRAIRQADFYLVNKPGSVLNCHNHRFSEKFDADFISEMSHLWREIKNNLLESNKFTQVEKQEMPMQLFENWNNMILGKCWHHGPNLSNHAKCEILQKYVECFSSEELFDSFAPLPLFNKFTSLVKHSEFINNKINDIEKKYKNALHEKLNLENQVQCMRGSYSWRITYPFRKILQLFECYLLKLLVIPKLKVFKEIKVANN